MKIGIGMPIASESLVKKSMRPAAIVTYMSYSGLGIVRSLGRRGIPVFAVDPDLGQLGMSSKFCVRRQCPRIEESADQNFDFLLQLASSLPEKPVLFPTGDNLIHGYSAREEALKPYLRLTTPSSDIIQKISAKDALFRTARENSIPVPETFIPKSLEELRAISRSIPYPCLIKPVRSNSWHREAVQKKLKKMSGGSEKSILARTPAALVEGYQEISELDPDVIITEAIPGEDHDLLYFAFYRCSDGRIWHFSGRKNRVTPIHFGSASYVESIRDSNLDKISIEFLERLNYQGLGGIEFKRDSRDGKLKLIELNARYGLWDALGGLCGVDTAYVAYLDAIGEELPEPRQTRTGIKWLSIARDLSALRGYRREGALGIQEWAQTLAGEKMWAVFAWDDPMPAITASLRFSRRAIHRVANGFWSRRSKPSAAESAFARE
jgi:predicted ATP-grasp superfamily ATP-dependent carboligase